MRKNGASDSIILMLFAFSGLWMFTLFSVITFALGASLF